MATAAVIICFRSFKMLEHGLIVFKVLLQDIMLVTLCYRFTWFVVEEWVNLCASLMPFRFLRLSWFSQVLSYWDFEHLWVIISGLIDEDDLLTHITTVFWLFIKSLRAVLELHWAYAKTSEPSKLLVKNFLRVTNQAFVIITICFLRSDNYLPKIVVGIFIIIIITAILFFILRLFAVLLWANWRLSTALKHWEGARLRGVMGHMMNLLRRVCIMWRVVMDVQLDSTIGRACSSRRHIIVWPSTLALRNMGRASSNSSLILTRVFIAVTLIRTLVNLGKLWYHLFDLAVGVIRTSCLIIIAIS